MILVFRLFFCLIMPFVLATLSWADGLSRADEDIFENHVRPVLTAHCIQCHGATKQEGGLRLTSLADILKGGESGPAIVSKDPGESLIVQAIRYESFEMPPDEPLKEQQIAGLVKWIAAGAPWPKDVVLKPLTALTAQDHDWWCYQPIEDSPPPTCDDDSWCKSDVDRFVLARLESEGVQPSSPASNLTLARRVHYSLTGLPPDAESIREAMSPDFDYAALVDRLLDSEAYGENQARHWLDLVRYADSDGYRADHARPEAFRYRDYVIRSFNEDKPYDRFILEQLAGDEVDPGNRDAHIATMYLRHWIYEHNQRDVETQWHEILSDITETTSDVFLAQGLKCARCHDHKFDPLLQKDYFRFKAFFAAFQPSENHPIADVEKRLAYQEELDRWKDATADIRRQLREIEYPVVLKHATREGFDKFIPKIKEMIKKPAEERDPYEMQIASLAERQFDLPYDKLKEWLSAEEESKRQELRKRLSEMESMKPEPLPTMKFVGSDVGPIAPDTTIPDQEDQGPIEPGYLTLLDPDAAKIDMVPAGLRSTGRRSTLGRWIASEKNPLTARVIVNRIWQQHFGRGLVETSSDFGHLGVPPTHPKLLDYLASRFTEHDWSIKKFHRLVLLSATYQQTSRRTADEKINMLDPDNRLLWRMNPRRLSGEEINDTVLLASGELKTQKRAIFKKVNRNKLDPVLAAFDAPDRIRSMGKRHFTTTSTQALLMANSGWANERAKKIAKRFAQEDDDSLVQTVYRLLFGREVSQEEQLLAKEFLERYQVQTPTEHAPEVETLVQMPMTKSKAVAIKPDGPVAMSLKSSDKLPDGDFTVEAVVLLRSLYGDANVRTIVAHWSGSKKTVGWSLGVTSTKSAFKPRNLILQLVGNTADDKELHYEVVPSGLRPELNKPYYLAARVDLDDPSENGITFYMKDLSKPTAKLQTAKAKHKVTSNIRPKNDLTIGGRFGNHVWDGLIDSIRVEPRTRDLSLVAQADSPQGLPDYVIDWQFENPEKLGHDSSGKGNHAWAKVDKPVVVTPAERARVALVHTLINSNEMIYVD